jgi:hypothetical protein
MQMGDLAGGIEVTITIKKLRINTRYLPLHGWNFM